MVRGALAASASIVLTTTWAGATVAAVKVSGLSQTKDCSLKLRPRQELRRAFVMYGVSVLYEISIKNRCGFWVLPKVPESTPVFYAVSVTVC